MSQFPSDLVEQIIYAKGLFKEKIGKAQAERKNVIDQLSKEIEEITASHDDAIRNVKKAQSNLNSEKQYDSLLQKKKDLLQQKEEFKQNIQELQEQIQKIQSESDKINYAASFSLIKSIAPVRFTSITPNRLAGVISFGTPQSTEGFDFNRANPDEIPEKFWKKLLRCSDARYNVEHNSPNDWCNDNGLAW